MTVHLSLSRKNWGENMNTNMKGDLLETIVMSIYEKQGYELHQAQRVVKSFRGGFASYKIDIFGSDIIGKRMNCPTLWIQVTAFTGTNKRDKMLEHQWSMNNDLVLYYRFATRSKGTFFIVHYMGQDRMFHKALEFKVSLDRFFDAVNAWYKIKSVSIKEICEYLMWDRKEFIKMRKEI